MTFKLANFYIFGHLQIFSIIIKNPNIAYLRILDNNENAMPEDRKEIANKYRNCK